MPTSASASLRNLDADDLCDEFAEEAEELHVQSADLSIYREDPVGYAETFLGVTLTEPQRAMLRSLVTHRRTAVKASHAVGKTFLAAVAACWWYDCWPEHIVYITAPSWPQALGLTFKAITRLRRERGLPGQILESGLIRDEDKYLAGAHFIKAINAETGEGFQGEHTSDILQLYEEAVGVPGYIWEAGNGLLTSPGCRLLAIANPTDEATLFGEACAQKIYNVITICGLDHPNIAAELRGESMPFPKAVSLTWLNEMIEAECDPAEGPGGDAFEFPPGSGTWWIPNAVFQGRVLGEFPSQADRQVIPRGWLRDLPVLRAEVMPQIGCDVARHGTDRTTIAARSGPCVLFLREIRKMDVDVVAGALIETANEWGKALGFDPRKIPIHVDVTGGLGVGPVVFLRKARYRAVEVNSSCTAIEPERYYKKRSELWFVVRERARTKTLDLSRLSAEMRKKVERELSTPTWKPNSAGQKVVEPKDQIKDRLGESPDLADAVNLSFDGTGAGSWVDAERMSETQAQTDYDGDPEYDNPYRNW